MRTLVVTAADEHFAPLLRELVASLHQWQPRPFTALAVFDLGLAPATRAWVERRAAQVVAPEWDLPVETTLRTRQPAVRALTVRPFLPAYFPGYDVYLWLDGDTWVQRPEAFATFFDAAASGALAAAVEVDRAYRGAPKAMQWRMSRLDAGFGAGSGRRALVDRYVNAGAFALAADAPHWAVWRRCFETGLKATGGQLVCDQSALNQALWTEQLPLHPLPARFNWLCHLAEPRFDDGSGLWMEPYAPAQALAVLHLTSRGKQGAVGDAVAGGRSLRFPGLVPDE